jgi:ribosomal protein S18 acetylase RimI-like enzyme
MVQNTSYQIILDQLSHIFYITSGRNNFESEEAKNKFRFYYLDYFLQNYPDICFCAIDDSKKLVGYIVASPNTLKDDSLFDYHKYLELFRPHIVLFQAQLHINLLPETQGMGVGGLLMLALENQLKQQQVQGLFLITGKNSRNVSFYNKHQFIYQKVESFKDNPLIFMAKNLH